MNSKLWCYHVIQTFQHQNHAHTNMTYAAESARLTNRKAAEIRASEVKRSPLPFRLSVSHSLSLCCRLLSECDTGSGLVTVTTISL